MNMRIFALSYYEISFHFTPFVITKSNLSLAILFFLYYDDTYDSTYSYQGGIYGS